MLGILEALGFLRFRYTMINMPGFEWQIIVRINMQRKFEKLHLRHLAQLSCQAVRWIARKSGLYFDNVSAPEG
jgi:hypothetical protein